MSEDTKEMDKAMSQSMNPRVREVEIGIRTTRKTKIYPLSVADQFEMSDSITEGIAMYVKESGDGSLTPVSISKLIDLIRKKLPDVLGLVLVEEDPTAILKEMDNYQLASIAEIVFRDNYGEPVKKLASLFRPTMQGDESALERLSQLSAGPTPATDSNTSPN